MYRVLLVDDDAINRVAIVGMLHWETLGFEVVGTASNGKIALDYFKKERIDILITDMKMPIMDGLELIREIRKVNQEVIILAISSYSDFELVRKAFKSKIEDYILKTDLKTEILEEYMLKLKSQLDQRRENVGVLRESVSITNESNIENQEVIQQGYYTFIISVQNYENESKRYINLQKNLTSQMKEVVKFIPQFSKATYVQEYSRSSVIIRFYTEEILETKLHTLCRQLIQIFKNYMNIKVFIGVSDWAIGKEEYINSGKSASYRCSLSNVYGTEQIFIHNHFGDLDIDKMLSNWVNYAGVIEGLKELDEMKLFEKQSQLLNNAIYENTKELKERCLELMYFEGIMLEEVGDSIWSIWGEEINFYDKIERLQESSSVVMWIANYNRWIMEYLKCRHSISAQEDELAVVRHYIEDNYGNSKLSLNEVASIAGFNEKYFSSKFRKEMGMTFVEYVTNIRIDAAKNLLKQTNMKLVEISEAVGYNNVEHFVRVFKRKTGMSPREYEKHQ